MRSSILAFKHVGRTIEWKGEGLEEVGYDAKTGKAVVEIDPRYFRPTEVEELFVWCLQSQTGIGLGT